MGGCRDYAGASGDGVSYGDVTFMDGKTAASFFAWQNNDVVANNKGASLTKGVNADGSFYMYFESGKLEFSVLGTSRATHASVDAIGTLYSAGTWYFTAFTWSPGASTPNMSIYIDGSAISTTNTGANPASIKNSTKAMETGSFDGATIAMDGLMAYNGIYSSVLSLPQIVEHMWNPFCVFSNIEFMAPGWNPSATNEIDLVRSTSGTPTNASESFDGPPIGMFLNLMCQ